MQMVISEISIVGNLVGAYNDLADLMPSQGPRDPRPVASMQA